MHNVASWIESREKIKFRTAHNNKDPSGSSYQPGGIGIIITGRMTQSVKQGEQDNWKLGRYCSYVLWATASHKCRLVVVYNICNRKSEGLQTQYKQSKRYFQDKHINTGPKHLFQKAVDAQCGKWRKEGDRLIVIIDANEHNMDGKLRKKCQKPKQWDS